MHTDVVELACMCLQFSLHKDMQSMDLTLVLYANCHGLHADMLCASGVAQAAEHGPQPAHPSQPTSAAGVHGSVMLSW